MSPIAITLPPTGSSHTDVQCPPLSGNLGHHNKRLCGNLSHSEHIVNVDQTSVSAFCLSTFPLDGLLVSPYTTITKDIERIDINENENLSFYAMEL